MQRVWVNWSGSLRFNPERIETPEHEEQLVELVRQAVTDRRTVRVVGAGHSSSPILETNDILVSLEKFQGVESYNTTAHEATIRAGMTLRDAGQALLEVGLATHNTGDVDVQMVAGTIGTGTHGTGKRLKNLSTMLVGGRMITGRGEILEFSSDQPPEFIRAARVSLGTLGIFTKLKLRLLPAFQLHRREWCTHIDDCLAHLDQLIAENRNFDFYWYPRRDEAKLRTLNPPGQGLDEISYAIGVEEKTGWSAEVLPKARDLKFDEMEYSLCPPKQARRVFKRCANELKRSIASTSAGAFSIEPSRRMTLI
jgi:FAD/FMN-containing dehydrogenase